MGKAKVKQNLGEGLYKITLQFDKGNYQQQLDEVKQKIEDLTRVIKVLSEIEAESLDTYASHLATFNNVLTYYASEARQIPSNTWISGTKNSARLTANAELLSLESLNKIVIEKLNTISLSGIIHRFGRALDTAKNAVENIGKTYFAYADTSKLPASYVVSEYNQQGLEDISAAKLAFNQGKTLIKGKLVEWRLEKLTAEKRKAKLDSTKFEFDFDAWCMDYTLNLDIGKEIASVELTNERNIVVFDKTTVLGPNSLKTESVQTDDSLFPALIRPAFFDNAKYDSKRDGVITPVEFMSVNQFAFNWLALPAHALWKPTYRRGYLRKIYPDGLKGDVELEKHYSSQPDKYRYIKRFDVTQVKEPIYFDGEKYGWHMACPIVYMSCNGAAFKEGDHVIVEYENQDRKKPRVIGFVDHPRACIEYEFFISDRVSNDYIGSHELALGNIFSFIQGDAVRVGGVNQATPVFSHIREDQEANPPGKPARWEIISYRYPTNSNERLPNEISSFKANNAFQNQRLFEYIFFPKNTVKTFMFSPAGAGPYARTTGKFSGYFSKIRQIFGTTKFGVNIIDVGLDIRATLYGPDSLGGREKPKIFPIGGLPVPRYWRRHAMQIVNGVAYVIASDALSRFYVYPLADYGLVDDDNNGGIRLNDPKIKSFDIPWPAWVKLDEIYTNNLFYWNFSNDGKQAVTIVHTNCIIPNTYTYLGYTCKTPPNGLETIFGRNVEQASGLVEIEIIINIIDDKVSPYGHNFTATCKVITENFSCQTGRLILAADYAYKNKKLSDNGIKENDLITLDFDLRLNNGLLNYFTSITGIDPNFASYEETIQGFANIWEHRQYGIQISDPADWFLSAEFSINRNEREANGVLIPHKVISIPTVQDMFTDLRRETITAIRVGNADYPTHPPSWRVYPFEQGSYYDVRRIEALDLRSCSCVVSHNDGQAIGESLGFYYYIFGEFREGKTEGATRPPIVDQSKLKIPKSLQWLAGYISLLHFNPNPFQSISTHPDGHFAVGLPRLYAGTGREMDVDLIVFADGTETTHLAEYNRAFADNREYSYYSDNRFALRGMTRTFGVWI